MRWEVVPRFNYCIADAKLYQKNINVQQVKAKGLVHVCCFGSEIQVLCNFENDYKNNCFVSISTSLVLNMVILWKGGRKLV